MKGRAVHYREPIFSVLPSGTYCIAMGGLLSCGQQVKGNQVLAMAQQPIWRQRVRRRQELIHRRLRLTARKPELRMSCGSV